MSDQKVRQKIQKKTKKIAKSEIVFKNVSFCAKRDIFEKHFRFCKFVLNCFLTFWSDIKFLIIFYRDSGSYKHVLESGTTPNQFDMDFVHAKNFDVKILKNYSIFDIF